MVGTRIAVLCGLCCALGGCLSLADTPRAYTGLPPTAAIADTALPSVVEPGQLLRPGLGRSSDGVNPTAALQVSEQARTAWVPLNPSVPILPAAHLADGAATLRPTPGSTADTARRTTLAARPDVGAQPYDREAVMERLEREGKHDAQPICGGC